VTCGHVASKGDLVISKGQSVGTATYSFDPFSLPGVIPPSICRPNSPGVSRLDMALVEIASAPSIKNILTNNGAVIQSGDLIEMRANGSSHSYEVGGVVITFKIHGKCFDRLFEVRPRRSSLLSPLANAAFARMPAPGDSGAWFNLAGTMTWCGMLIAGEPLMAYALEADDLVVEANRAFSLDLELS